MAKQRQDLRGKKIGRWTVIYFSHVKNKNGYWKCLCDCGNEGLVSHSNLLKSWSQSCGCLQKERAGAINLIHGKSESALHQVYCNINSRCENQKHKSFQTYGKLGVKMCQEWKDEFMKFYQWAIDSGWKKGLHICRKGDVGDYSPDNCYIATKKQNSQDNKKNKLNMWKARVIRVMHRNHGWGSRKQGVFWGVDQSTICDIIYNRTWAA